MESKKDHEVDFEKYVERTAGFTNATYVISNKTCKTADKTIIAPMQMWVLELEK